MDLGEGFGDVGWWGFGGDALWVLGHHREVQDRVAAEVADLPDRALTREDVPRLGYTVQVLHEALRLCPPGAGVPRTVMRDIAIDGFRLEAGTVEVVGIYAMHRDAQLWEDPLVFDRTGSASNAPRAAAVGSICRSAPGSAPASALISPCWRPRWR